MPVYNGEKYLSEAIESVLAQTFTDFELLIVNDASTDNSLSIIQNYNDDRIRVIDNKFAKGIAGALNTGIDEARGDLIARMDSDDICNPDRLEIQFDYLEKNKNVDICGSWLKTFGELDGVVWKHPLNDEDIKIQMLFSCPIAHPSVIFRKNKLILHNLKYLSERNGAEDYELWVRASAFLNFANIPQELLNYRVLKKSYEYTKRQNRFSEEIRIQQLKKIVEADMHRKYIALHEKIVHWELEYNPKFIESSQNWFNLIIKGNALHKIYPVSRFKNRLHVMMYDICWAIMNEKKLGLKDVFFLKINLLIKLKIIYFFLLKRARAAITI